MLEYKTSKEDYVGTKGLHRLGKLKWWYLVLIIVGLLALVTLWISQGGQVIQQLESVGAVLSPISPAHAQSVEELAAGGFTPKVLIMAGIFIVLGLVYIAGIFKLFFSDNSNQIDTASDLVKTLTGFFVGAATGILG